VSASFTPSRHSKIKEGKDQQHLWLWPRSAVQGQPPSLEAVSFKHLSRQNKIKKDAKAGSISHGCVPGAAPIGSREPQNPQSSHNLV